LNHQAASNSIWRQQPSNGIKTERKTLETHYNYL